MNRTEARSRRSRVVILMLAALTTLGVSWTLSFAQTPEAFVWVQGRAPVTLFRTSEGFCFLTLISGNFRGYGEAVRLEVRSDRWVLGGQSLQQGVSATAHCVPWSAFTRIARQAISGAFEVESGVCPWPVDCRPNYIPERGVRMSDLQSICFLTGMSGEFKRSEHIRIHESETHHILWAAAWPHARVKGHSTCIDLGQKRVHYVYPPTVPAPNPFPGTPWGAFNVSEFAWKHGGLPTPMALVSKAACYLTGVYGEFAGSAEAVMIVPWNDRWMLLGRSQHYGVAARARCVAYRQGTRPSDLPVAPRPGARPSDLPLAPPE